MSDSPPVPLRAAVVAVQLPGVDDRPSPRNRRASPAGAYAGGERGGDRDPAAPDVASGGAVRERKAGLAAGAGRPHRRGDRRGRRRRRRGDGDEATPATTTASEIDDPTVELEASDEAPGLAPIEAVLVDHDISPSQARNLEKATGVEVLDRRPSSWRFSPPRPLARGQGAGRDRPAPVMVPRLREQGKGKDRQRGGIGGKGAGESSLELDRRRSAIASPS